MNNGLNEFKIIRKDKTSKIKLTKDKFNELADIVEQALLSNARDAEVLQKYYNEGITFDSVNALSIRSNNYSKLLYLIYNKRVAIDLITNPDVKDYIAYNSHCAKYDFIVPLTKEEFELLRYGMRSFYCEQSSQ